VIKKIRALNVYRAFAVCQKYSAEKITPVLRGLLGSLLIEPPNQADFKVDRRLSLKLMRQLHHQKGIIASEPPHVQLVDCMLSGLMQTTIVPLD